MPTTHLYNIRYLSPAHSAEHLIAVIKDQQTLQILYRVRLLAIYFFSSVFRKLGNEEELQSIFVVQLRTAVGKIIRSRSIIPELVERLVLRNHSRNGQAGRRKTLA